MKTLKDLLHELNSLNKGIGDVLNAANFRSYDDLSSLQINYQSPEDLFLLDELVEIMGKLEDINNSLTYLSKPIAGTYTLHKNRLGRYECAAHEYTSGNAIECLVYDSYHDAPSWVYTRIEHDGNDYYLVGYKEIPLEGLTVHIRGVKE